MKRINKGNKKKTKTDLAKLKKWFKNHGFKVKITEEHK